MKKSFLMTMINISQRHIIFKGAMVKMTVKVSTEIMGARIQWNIFKILKENLIWNSVFNENPFQK